MSAYEATIDEVAWTSTGKDAEKTVKQVAYAASLQYAAKLAGDNLSRVAPSAESLQGFVKRHINSPLVDKALHKQRFPPAVLADVGGSQAFHRWGRSGLTLATRIAVSDADIERAERQPHTMGPYVVAAIPMQDDMLNVLETMPIGVLGSPMRKNALANIDVPLPPVFAESKKRKHSSSAAAEDENDVDEEGNDDEGEDGDEGDEGDGEEEDGEDLDALAAEDDAESVGTYDLNDDFIAHDDSEDDAASESSTSSSQSESLTDNVEPIVQAKENDGIIDVTLAAQDAISVLEALHPVPEFDGKAQLYESGLLRLANGSVIEARHTYVVNGDIGYTSTTTLIGKWFEPFDAPGISLGMVKSPKWQNNYEYRGPAEAWATEKLRESWQNGTFAGDLAIMTKRSSTAAKLFLESMIGWDVAFATLTGDGAAKMLAMRLQEQWQFYCAEHIQQTWTHAAVLGTAMHKRIEDFFEQRTERTVLEAAAADQEPELLQFLQWYDTWLVPGEYEPFRMELRIFSEEMRVSGSVDALFRHKRTGKIIMVDWKRAKKIEMEGFNGKTGKGPLADVPSCNFYKYVMQQNLYKRMLERATNLRIDSMWLLICHPRQGSEYKLLAVPERPEHMQRLYEARMHELQGQRLV